jgi:hypothetical protein
MRVPLRRYGFKDVSKITRITPNPAEAVSFFAGIAGLVGPIGLH